MSPHSNLAVRIARMRDIAAIPTFVKRLKITLYANENQRF
jgi:hypothetical protein